jgi:hypothetical protein
MGDINSARAKFGLQATGTPTNTNVSGLQRVGEWPSTLPLAGANITYSFQIGAPVGGETATLDLTTGVVTGTAIIIDGDGKDFEGDTLPALVTLQSVYVKGGEFNLGDLSFTNTIGADQASTIRANDVSLWASNTGLPNSSDSYTFTLGASGDGATVTVTGKTS